MKKLIILILIVLLGICHMNAQQATKKKSEPKAQKSIVHGPFGANMVTKTYTIKHINPSTAYKVIRPYILSGSYSKETNLVTVNIYKQKIKEMEKLLNKIDVERKSIQFTIFTVIASNTQKENSSKIRNSNLKKVLDKLNEVLSFKSFTLDGVSFLPVKDGQRRAELITSSQKYRLSLQMKDVKLQMNAKKRRSVSLILSLHSRTNGDLITTETSVNENGYLVAGVSKIGRNGDSLILIISAKIVD